MVKKVLIMDDEEVIRTTTADMLEQLGYNHYSVGNGEEMLTRYEAALSDDPFDLVILDLTIPGGMGGEKAVKKLLELNSSAVAVVCSGYATLPVMTEYESYGFQGRLLKPFTIEELSSLLKRLIPDK